MMWALEAMRSAKVQRSEMRVQCARDVERQAKIIADREKLPLIISDEMPRGAIWLSAVRGQKRLDVEVTA
jgi:hypothetical protein